MVIEESIIIDCPLEEVWAIFTDLTCWAEWNSVLENKSVESLRVEEGRRFRFCIRPFVIPVYFEPMIEEVVPLRKIRWRGEKFGITAIHEYIFEETKQGVSVTSREAFSGSAVTLSGILFSKWRLRELTFKLLEDLKEAAEDREGYGPKN